MHLLQPLLSTSWLCWVKTPCTPAGKAARTNTPAGQKHECSTVCRGAGDIAPEVVLLSRTDWPSRCHPWQKTLWPSGSGVGLLSRWGLPAWARIPQVSCVCKVALCGRRIHCKSGKKKTTSKSSRPGLVRHDGTRQAKELFWELNPGPLAPEARIMPLDQTANGAHVSSGTCNYCSPCCQPHGSAG